MDSAVTGTTFNQQRSVLIATVVVAMLLLVATLGGYIYLTQQRQLTAPA